MRTTAITDCVFGQDTDAAKRAAEDGPVIVTDQGRPAYALLSYADYRRLAGVRSLLDAVAQKDDDDFDFEPPRMGDTICRAVDFD